MVKSIEIAGRPIGDDFKPFIMAEVGINHEGSYDKSIQLVDAALKAGALGVNISGSGPSVFALANGKQKAEEVKKAMENQYLKEKINFNIYLSGINEYGVKIL